MYETDSPRLTRAHTPRGIVEPLTYQQWKCPRFGATESLLLFTKLVKFR